MSETSYLVTGGTGFLGQAIASLLRSEGHTVTAAGSAMADLRSPEETHGLIGSIRPDVVVHCAVQGGGIGWMRKHPVESGIDNVRINVNLLEASHSNGVRSFVGVSSACAYPKVCPVPFQEEDLWNGYPEPSNGSYALSKRIMMDLGRAYAEQHGFHSVFPVLANLYGPGDHLDSERAHVVADLMIRCASSPSELVVWGTGAASREFLYVDDAAKGVLASLSAPAATVVNIGTGIETPIASLAKMVAEAHGLSIPLRFDPSKPDGQLRKVLATGRASGLFGWRASTSLESGLASTARWYRERLC
jgi:GDP-L-fucose synthase